MAPQRWTDEMLDRQAETVEQLLEGQRMLVQIYQQEHEARVEADRRFNRFIEEQQQINRQLAGTLNGFIEEQQQINRQLAEAINELRRIVYFRTDNGNQN